MWWPRLCSMRKCGATHRAIGEDAEQDVEPVRLVAELVPDQQRAAVDGADAEQQRDVGPPRQLLGAEEGNQRDVVDPGKRHAEARQPQIIRIGLHRGHHFGRRIVGVLAEDDVEQRDQDEDEDEGDQRHQRIVRPAGTASTAKNTGPRAFGDRPRVLRRRVAQDRARAASARTGSSWMMKPDSVL